MNNAALHQQPAAEFECTNAACRRPCAEHYCSAECESACEPVHCEHRLASICWECAQGVL